MKKSKYIEDYFIQKLPNGIYMLTFNTTERWIPYHAYNDYEFVFGPELNETQYSEDECFKHLQECQQQVPEFLPKLEKQGHYVNSCCQNKDQITFYYMSFYYEWIKENKIENIEIKEN